MSDAYFYILIWSAVSLSHLATGIGGSAIILYFNPLTSWLTIWKSNSTFRLLFLMLVLVVPLLYIVHGTFGFITVILAIQNLSEGQNPFYQSIGALAEICTMTGTFFQVAVAAITDILAILLYSLKQPVERATMLEAYMTLLRLKKVVNSVK